MESFILDCSMTMAWCFDDEATPETRTLLASMKEKHAIVPSLWSLEVSNTLIVAERRNRITKETTRKIIAYLRELPIEIDHTISNYSSDYGLTDIIELGWKYKLSAYDATYLDLAIREKLPLATLDKSLKSAAKELNLLLKL